MSAVEHSKPVAQPNGWQGAALKDVSLQADEIRSRREGWYGYALVAGIVGSELAWLTAIVIAADRFLG